MYETPRPQGGLSEDDVESLLKSRCTHHHYVPYTDEYGRTTRYGGGTWYWVATKYYCEHCLDERVGDRRAITREQFMRGSLAS